MKTISIQPLFRACRGSRVRRDAARRVPALISAGLVLLITHLPSPINHSAFAQCTYSSGSTGTNGDFNPPISWPTNSGWSVSNDVTTGKTIVTVTNMPNGIFHFRRIYIETNYVVNFTKNVLNTPVYLLATTDVTINGTIDVSGADQKAGQGGLGGPGGYDG